MEDAYGRLNIDLNALEVHTDQISFPRNPDVPSLLPQEVELEFKLTNLKLGTRPGAEASQELIADAELLGCHALRLHKLSPGKHRGELFGPGARLAINSNKDAASEGPTLFFGSALHIVVSMSGSDFDGFIEKIFRVRPMKPRAGMLTVKASLFTNAGQVKENAKPIVLGPANDLVKGVLDDITVYADL